MASSLGFFFPYPIMGTSEVGNSETLMGIDQKGKTEKSPQTYSNQKIKDILAILKTFRQQPIPVKHHG